MILKCIQMLSSSKQNRLGGSAVKNLPANSGDAGSSLGWEDPLEEETATHSSILAWRILWTEKPGGQQSMRSQRVRHDRVTEYAYITGRPRPFLHAGWG